MSRSRENPVVTADITSVGGAAFDVFLRAPHETVLGPSGARFLQFPLGAKVKVESVIQGCGGGAANTSVGFARLGMCARFCGIVGDDQWGKEIQKTLKKEGVLTDAAIVVEGEVSSFSIILVDPASGDRTILYSPNVNAHMHKAVFAKDLLRQSTWMFLNHLSDVSCVILDDCLELVRKPHGLHFAWNPGGSQIRGGMRASITRELLRETDILFLNAEEALTFTAQPPGQERVQAIAQALRDGARAGVKLLCITDGANGAYISDGTTVHFSPPPRNVQVVDTTGAGDAFAVGVTWGVFSGLDLSDALKAGMLNAASVIGKVGTQAGLLTDTEIRSALSAIALPVTSSAL